MNSTEDLGLCSEKYLPESASICKNSNEDYLSYKDCLEDALENIVARRCLKYSETDDVVFPSVECIIEAQNNASRVIGELLGIEITKVKLLKGLYSNVIFIFRMNL